MGLKEKLRKILKIGPRIMRKLRKIVAPFRRIGLKKEYTLFSDNCWGGRTYDKFGLPYLSPTIGLAMSKKDYISFLENVEHYVSLDLVPIEEEQRKVNDEYGFYLCMLGDLRINFVHYRDVNDAIQKWNRRKARIRYDNIIVKMSMYEKDYDEEILNRFLALPYKKILFIEREELAMKYNDDMCRTVYFPKENTDSEFIYSDKKLKLKELKKFINS